jgi:hypothetical protein
LKGSSAPSKPKTIRSLSLGRQSRRFQECINHFAFPRRELSIAVAKLRPKFESIERGRLGQREPSVLPFFFLPAQIPANNHRSQPAKSPATGAFFLRSQRLCVASAPLVAVILRCERFCGSSAFCQMAPLFLTITALLLVTAWYLTYWRPKFTTTAA